MARCDLQVAGLDEEQETRLRAQRFRRIGETGRRLAFCDAPHVEQPAATTCRRKGRRLRSHAFLEFRLENMMSKNTEPVEQDADANDSQLKNMKNRRDF